MLAYCAATGRFLDRYAKATLKPMGLPWIHDAKFEDHSNSMPWLSENLVRHQSYLLNLTGPQDCQVQMHLCRNSKQT